MDAMLFAVKVTTAGPKLSYTFWEWVRAWNGESVCGWGGGEGDTTHHDNNVQAQCMQGEGA